MHYKFVLITSQTSVTITCGIQPTGIVTMAMEVLQNSCNMCTRDLPDMYALRLWACISGNFFMPMLQLLHIRIAGVILILTFTAPESICHLEF